MTALHERLRAETQACHDRLEALPFLQALRDGTLPAAAVVSLLRCLAIVHAVVERALPHAPHKGIAGLAAYTRGKLPLLVADLATVGAAADAAVSPSVVPAIERALECGADILRRADNPFSLLGTLYVLEGSQGGGVVLRDAYARCLGVPADRLSYWGCYGSQTAAHWTGFTDRLDALTCDDEDARQVVASAVRCFDWIERILGALHPHAGESLGHHVAALNFEAGDHAMPQDPREIEMALRAGRLAWERYPYLEVRFGDRGRRFTSSDSCWLFTLTALPEPRVTKSLEWLRTVLASRGIPTVVLEAHLTLIEQVCAAREDGSREQAGAFSRFLADRGAERESVGNALTLRRLTTAWDERLGRCDGFTVASAAELVVSAWIDERSGVSGALASVHGWFTDPERFSPHWIATVRALVADLDQVTGTPC